MTRVPNALIHSASPYLLQHAYNPVQWFPWGEEALRKAQEENKLIIVSIGYSACHWCHVMEKESFEDEEVATVMNKSFVCIKVDREERPDIDQVYMDAVQLMTGRGGWPLNIIALPDQRPLYGGTYFPKEQWRQVLLQLAAFFRNDPGKCHEYAEELTSGVQKLGRLIPVNDDGNRGMPAHPVMIQEWAKQWDREEGGPLRAPKFPMPDGYRYLLAAATQLKLDEAEEQVHLTLHKMAHGGIYDQLGGGFSRYSTDLLWKVPHFEKMLYDNALLVSLYADAFKRRPLPLYREVVAGTLDFVSREMTSPGGGFYSALDADTEGVEGKFYCWNIDELRALLGEEAELAQDYFSINEKGYWEHDRYILLRNDNEEELALRHRTGIEEFRQRIHVIKQKMFASREERVRPGLDDKILCSWNAMMMTAFLDAWAALGDPSLLDAAQKSAD
ncbi:MAG: thioredoxin domain-containing protein, partial [Bacteroidia bacterium]|nr:thioredoxin domain-containing protein [Bacteroidia bacterium]